MHEFQKDVLTEERKVSSKPVYWTNEQVRQWLIDIDLKVSVQSPRIKYLALISHHLTASPLLSPLHSPLPFPLLSPLSSLPLSSPSPLPPLLTPIVFSLQEYADNVTGSGLHGALLVFEQSLFTPEYFSSIIGIKASHLRKHLHTELNSLLAAADEESRK